MNIENWLGNNKTKNLTGDTNPANSAIVVPSGEKVKLYEENSDPNKLIKEKNELINNNPNNIKSENNK